MSPLPELVIQAEEVLAPNTVPMEGKQQKKEQMKVLSKLAQGDRRWRQLLNDPDHLFSGTEAISPSYERYLMGVICKMEETGCTFKQAVVLASCSDDQKYERALADYLKLRKAGYAASDALVANLNSSGIGPSRASICDWRRKEARSLLSKGALAVEIAEATLVKGLDCTEYELTVVEQSLAEGQRLCWHLDRSLEILEANSRACGEGESVMAEYAELYREAIVVNSNLEAHATHLTELKSRMWSFEYLTASVRYLFTPPSMSQVFQARMCTSLGASTDMLSRLKSAQEMRIEVIAAMDEVALNEMEQESMEDSVVYTSDVDVIYADRLHNVAKDADRTLYVEVEVGSCRRTAPMDDCKLQSRHMLFAYGGEPTVHIRVFEKSNARFQSLFGGNIPLGEAYMLVEPPSEDWVPRSVDLPVWCGAKKTGSVSLRYQLIAH